MAERLKSATHHKGFIIQEIVMAFQGATIKDGEIKPRTNHYTRWRISAMDDAANHYIVASSKHIAERKIDSGQAQAALDKMRAASKKSRGKRSR